jgi:putative thioredoxin
VKTSRWFSRAIEINRSARSEPVEQAPPQYIVEVTEQNVQHLLEQSMQMPIVFAFLSPADETSQQVGGILERIANEQQGKLMLATVNMGQQQMIAQQFGVQSVPDLKLVYQGRLANELNGSQTEASIREWLAPVLGGEQDDAAREDEFIERVRQAIEAGQGDQAEQALRQALQQEPERHRLRATLVEYLLGESRTEEAQSVLAEVTEDVEELRPFRARFALLEELEGEDIPPLSTLAERIGADNPEPRDLYSFGLQAASSGRFREGLDALLQLMRDHREWNDGAAKKGLLKVLDCLPQGDPLASEYRRRMFNYLY